MNGRRGPKLGTSPFTHLVGELLAHGHRRARELDDTSVPLPRLPRAQKMLRQKPETQSGREDRVQMPVDRELQGRVEPRRAVGL